MFVLLQLRTRMGNLLKILNCSTPLRGGVDSRDVFVSDEI